MPHSMRSAIHDYLDRPAATKGNVEEVLSVLLSWWESRFGSEYQTSKAVAIFIGLTEEDRLAILNRNEIANEGTFSTDS